MRPGAALGVAVAIESKLGAVLVGESIERRDVTDSSHFEGIGNLLEVGGIVGAGLGLPGF